MLMVLSSLNKNNVSDQCIWLQEEGVNLIYSESSADLPENYMDRWILSFTQSLVRYVKVEMEGTVNYLKTKCLKSSYYYFI